MVISLDNRQRLGEFYVACTRVRTKEQIAFKVLHPDRLVNIKTTKNKRFDPHKTSMNKLLVERSRIENMSDETYFAHTGKKRGLNEMSENTVLIGEQAQV